VGGLLGSGATFNSGAFVLGSTPSGLYTITLDDTATQLLLQINATATPASAYLRMLLRPQCQRSQ